MKTFARGLFILGLFCFVVAGIFWTSLSGVIAWRVGVSFVLIGIGLSLLWPESMDARKEAGKIKLSLPLFLHLGHIIAIGFALSIYRLQEEMGMAAIYLLMVVAPLLIVLTVGWQVLHKKLKQPLADRLLPIVSLILFLLPFILDLPSMLYGVMREVPMMVLLNFITYAGIILLGVVLYRFYRRLTS